MMTRPPLRYHGGKWIIAPWIIAHFPPHRIYVEPFGGAASVLLRKPRAPYAEVYNDLSGDVVNVFRVLRDRERAGRLRGLLELTPFSREEYEGAAAALENGADPVERARLTIVRSFMGFGSAATNRHHVTGFRHKSRRSNTTPAWDWRNYPEYIPHFVRRLQGVTIEHRDAIELIEAQDGPEVLFYVDPPYLHETRGHRSRNTGYEHEMDEDDHRRLAEVLHEAEGMVVISGYAHELYDEELYADWRRVERGGWQTDGNTARTEVLWLNPQAAMGTQPSLFTNEEE